MSDQDDALASLRELTTIFNKLARELHHAYDIPRVLVIGCSAKSDGALLIGAYAKGPDEIEMILKRALEGKDRAELRNESPGRPKPA